MSAPTAGSLLPSRILPPTVSWGTVQPDGTVIIAKDWWLLLYNLCNSVLGALPADALQALASLEADTADTDAVGLRSPLADLAVMMPTEGDPVPFADVRNALVLAQDGLLQDSAPTAQPVVVITPGGSPYTYTAPFNGQVVVTAGTVSAIAIIRQGTSVATGLTVGTFPVSRGDGVIVTYSGTPTMSFLPT